MASRADLGRRWSDIIADWYLGTPPPLSPTVGWAALGALQRLWPEYLTEMLMHSRRGISVIAPAVDLGMTLLVCESLPGFTRVLARMKRGERSAISEAHVLATLGNLGYPVVVEPEIGGKRPDAAVLIGDDRVYVEVVAPDESRDAQRMEAGMRDLARRLIEDRPGVSVNVYLLVDPADAVVEAIRRLVRLPPTSPGETTHELPGVGFVQVLPFDGPDVPPPPSRPEVRTSPATTMVVGKVTFDEHGRALHSRATVRLPLADLRAQRAMRGEAQHFSSEEMNMLVMNVSAVRGSMRSWSSLIQRQFQPTRNRRFGAVAFFNSFLDHTTIVRRWSFVPNTHAVRPLPDALLKDLVTISAAAILD